MAAHVPKIVADLTVTGQVGALSQTTLWTPSSDGTFRVSAYLVIDDSSSSGSRDNSLEVTWTDDNNVSFVADLAVNATNSNLSYGYLSVGTGGNPGARYIRVKGSSNLIIRAKSTFSSTYTYSVFVTVEEL